MLILMNTGGIAMTNCFLIADEAAKQAVLFDAPDHTAAKLLDQAAARGWTLSGLWLTHGHFDHFADHSFVKERYPAAQIRIHALDEPKARHPEIQTCMFGVRLRIAPLAADAYATDGQRLRIGAIEVTVIHTPGHSPGHVCYYLPGEQVVVGGDLIIGGSVGRTDLPDSDHRQLESSVRKIMALPPQTRLLGGHGPPTTLAEEREQNPFVRQIIGYGCSPSSPGSCSHSG